MIRLFITTDLESTQNMYDIHSGYEPENSKALHLLEILPKEIDFGSNKIIILQDERNNNEPVVSTDWNNWAINSENDFILFHQTHPPSNEILKKFKANKGGSHIIGGYHDKIYGILFDDKSEKFSIILEILGFTEKEITEKETLESKLNFLLSIYNGDNSVLKPLPDFLEPIKSNLEESIEFLSEKLYNINDDMDDFENKGAEQRKHLRILRDALLNH